MARYYALSIEPNLFGDICLLRKWGRIGTKGQMMVHHFRREEEAVELFLDLLRQKRKRGYRPRASGCRRRAVRRRRNGDVEGFAGGKAAEIVGGAPDGDRTDIGGCRRAAEGPGRRVKGEPRGQGRTTGGDRQQGAHTLL